MSHLRIFASSSARKRERGSVLVVAMVALVALATLGGLTVVTVRSSLSGTTHDQFKAVALAAAEAGVAVGIDYARRNLQPDALWTGLVFPFNIQPDGFVHPLPGNDAKPGETGNVFSEDTKAWYHVEFYNNLDDGQASTIFAPTTYYTGFFEGKDTDGRIIIRSIGHGPNNASVMLEVEIQSPTMIGDKCGAGLGNNDGFSCGTVRNDFMTPPNQTPL